ncbi:hypothetical protein [Mucilaginibacter sp. AK015]|uniref:hypothetical protein n=1 Tax=Mucilaginibacter sp. AK015 TaxID=2723072 RepID=UPI00161C0269|nr:hypothetical protein [Mucilaginibacter sp. AK015]MBB5395929.1 hypothetical protein [Mucilaginibacter sp. AK015]
MKKYFGILLLMFVNCTAFAQYSNNIKRDATQMIAHMINKDYIAAAKYIMPKFIAASGGPYSLAKSIEASFAPMLQNGVQFDFSIDEPGAVIKTPSGLYTVMIQRTILNIPSKKTRGYLDSSLLALSTDKGKTWSFVDVGAMSDDQIKHYFPDVYGKLVIKPRGQPVYTQTE